jgi:hypothetical protein
MKQKNYLKIALIIILAITAKSSFGQTTLNKGDIALVAISTGQEMFAFATFVDLEQGTEIFFTDEEAKGSFTIGAGEGTVLYTAPSGGISAGTVITGSTDGSSTNFSSTDDGSLLLGNSGDGILAYQGSLGNVTTFLHAIGEDASDIGSYPANTLTSSDFLLLGSDDGNYSGITTGTITDLFSAINDVTNWTTSGAANINPVASFTVSSSSSPTPGISLGAVSNNTNETGSTATFTVVLNKEPATDVLLSISSGNTDEVTVLPSSVTFTNANWDTAQTITATGVDDAVIDGNIAVTITLSVDDDNSDDDYNSVADATTTITNEDDDFAAIVISEIMYNSPSTDDEWIEIYNTGGSQNISGWTIENTATSFTFTFPESTTIANGAYITIAVGSNGDSTYNNDYPFTPDYNNLNVDNLTVALTNNTDNLRNSSSVISLKNAGTTIDEVTYDDSDIDTTDGDGFTYEIIDATADNSSTSSNWRSSSNNGGSPGASRTTSWLGTTSDVWGLAENWDNGVPTTSMNVFIPLTATAAKVAIAAQAHKILMISGASLITKDAPTFAGEVTYQRTLDFVTGNSNGWYLVASPVSGQLYNDDYADTNGLATSSTRRGLATYNDAASSGNKWTYLENNDSNAGSFISGTGYSLKRGSVSGTISFTGTVNTDNVAAAVVESGNGFNLVGNPYTAYINSKTFLEDNTGNLVNETIWLWNQATGNYETQVSDSNFMLAPGQGFFVKANKTTSLNFDETYQTTNADTFQKSAKIAVTLLITDGTNDRFAKIYYSDKTTTSFDNGYDGETFGGIQNTLDVFTQLLSKNEGKNYQIQSLPDVDYENMVVPVGIKAIGGEEITFSAEALNLSSELKVFLEDRLRNTFTRLDGTNNSYKVTLTKALNGIGRFYLHTKSSSVLSTKNSNLKNISIYKTGTSNLRIVGLAPGKSTIQLFNILGKELMKVDFISNGVQDIFLPQLAAGIYIVQLASETGKINKKINIK